MKKLVNLAAAIGLALSAVGAATADQTAGPKSRVDVVAELNAARSSGELGALAGEDSGSFYLSQKAGANALTRRQVLADVVAVRRSAGLDWLTGEDSGSFVLSGTPAAAGRHYAGPNPGDTTTDAPARTASAK